MRNKKGQVRVFEAVFATAIILLSFYILSTLSAPTNPAIIRGEEDLEKIGYNVLNTMAEERIFDKIMFNEDFTIKDGWEDSFKVILQELLPEGILFNVTVYNATYQDGLVELNSSLQMHPIRNFEGDISKLTFVTMTYVYTTKVYRVVNPVNPEEITCKWTTLVIVMQLSRGETE